MKPSIRILLGEDGRPITDVRHRYFSVVLCAKGTVTAYTSLRNAIGTLKDLSKADAARN